VRHADRRIASGQASIGLHLIADCGIDVRNPGRFNE